MSEFNNCEKPLQCICGEMAAEIFRLEEAMEK